MCVCKLKHYNNCKARLVYLFQWFGLFHLKIGIFIFTVYDWSVLVTTDRVWREMFFCILQWFCNSLIVTWTSNQIGVLFKFRLRQGNFKQCRSDRNVHMGNFIIIAGIETIPIC